MIQKISNPGASATNSVVLINNTACCGGACVECEYLIPEQDMAGAQWMDFTFKNSVGATVVLRVDYPIETAALRTALVDFLEGIGYYVQSPLTDIYILNEDSKLTVSFFGCAEFVSMYSDIGGADAETLCDFTPICDYYFESNGNGVDPVPVSMNDVGGTVTAFTIADNEADVVNSLEDFFTTSTITVVKNEAAGYFEITLTGAPNDLIYIDGDQGIKSNCRKVYTA